MTAGIEQMQRHARVEHRPDTWDGEAVKVLENGAWLPGPIGGVTWRVGQFDFIAVLLPNTNFLHLQDEMASNPPEARKFCGGPPCESEILLCHLN